MASAVFFIANSFGRRAEQHRRASPGQIVGLRQRDQPVGIADFDRPSRSKEVLHLRIDLGGEVHRRRRQRLVLQAVQ